MEPKRAPSSTDPDGADLPREEEEMSVSGLVPLDSSSGLRATMVASGMAPWDAAVALVEAGAAPRWFRDLAGVPAGCLRAFARDQDAVVTFGALAKEDPGVANTALNAYLQGRVVREGLNLSNRKWVTALPEGLVVKVALYLMDTGVAALPTSLQVDGELRLTGSPVQNLPEGLMLGGALDLEGTLVTSLPDGLKVPGWFNLRGCRIAKLPENLVAGGSVWAEGTPLTVLPKGLYVPGTLSLEGSRLVALPEGLRVWTDLNVLGCDGWDGRIPEDAQVGHQVRTDRHPEGLPLEEWRERHPRGERP
jgi:hypothetical protein